jgi:GWxTD domain-containing protein
VGRGDLGPGDVKGKAAVESTLAPADRERFMDAFWKKRDLQPETPNNEFREAFLQRVAFADYAFAAPDARGATSDRGRVFVLLGIPSSVHRRPLTPLDRVQIVDRTVILNGNIEQWVYTNAQLPVKIAKKYVGYRFVTQEGIGDNVLQREEPYAFQALMFAMNPNDVKRKN